MYKRHVPISPKTSQTNDPSSKNEEKKNGINYNNHANSSTIICFIVHRIVETLTRTENFWSNSWNRIVDISGSYPL